MLGATVTEVTVGLAGGGADDELHPVNTRSRTNEARTEKVLKKLKNIGLGRTTASKA